MKLWDGGVKPYFKDVRMLILDQIHTRKTEKFSFLKSAGTWGKYFGVWMKPKCVG